MVTVLTSRISGRKLAEREEVPVWLKKGQALYAWCDRTALGCEVGNFWNAFLGDMALHAKSETVV